MNDPSRIYKEVDQLDFLSKQYNRFGLEPYKIHGMAKMRMISFFEDGTNSANDYCSCEKCLVGHFDKCHQCDRCVISANENDEEVVNENDIGELEENELPLDIYRELIKPGLYIALHSFSSSKLFYVCKVVNVCVAEGECMDENGHTVRKGKSFILGVPLSDT